MSELTRWFELVLRGKNYDDYGDAYDDSKYHELAKSWNVEIPQQYLRFVKQASKTQWIHLRLLADFMQIGKIPRDWTKPLSGPRNRVKIRVLEYFQDNRQPEAKHSIDTSNSNPGYGAEDLRGQIQTKITDGASFRLYVVEDLSRDVIEVLGTEFGIEPDFFRAHIAEYVWYNIRDRWRDNKPLELVRRRRDWWQIRYVTARYLEDAECFEDAVKEAKGFNILRRPDDDKSRGWWDTYRPEGSNTQCRSAVVAVTRCRATFWLKPNVSDGETATGVLLLDPTISKGFPLWRGHGNFHPVPWPPTSYSTEWPSWTSPSHEDIAERGFFEDFVYWARQPGLPGLKLGDMPRGHVLPVLVLLHLVGSEWQTMCEYIKTRLTQMDTETMDPAHFSNKNIDATLEKLDTWRRFIPIYREMVLETLQTILNSSCPEFNSAQHPSGEPSTHSCPHCPRTTASPQTWGIKAYEEDYKLVLGRLDEYQSRIDRLTSFVTAFMAVGDTRRAIKDARNIGFLTWLATFFIPFGVILASSACRGLRI